MPRRILTFAALVALALITPGTASAKPKPWVFVLAGQSNMAGRGLPVPAEKPTPGILQITRLGITPAVDPLNAEQGVGPGLTFAKAIKKARPDITIILVPCAKGATWMRQWERGQFLYNRCVKRARAAHGIVKGVLFAQGESDAQLSDVAGKWRSRFERFSRQFRVSLHAPRVPFIYTVLGRTTQPHRFHAWGAVQRAQRAAHVSHGMAVPTADLPLQDNVHFTVRSYHTLGLRMASAWTKLAG